MKNRLVAGLAVAVMVVACSSCRVWWFADVDDHDTSFCAGLWLAYGFHPAVDPADPDDPGVPAEPAAPAWARSAKTGPDGSVLFAASQGSGGVYAAGYIVGDSAYSFGNGRTAAGGFEGGANAVIIKYSSDGSAEWAAATVSGPGDSCFYSVAAAGDGIYAAGTIQGSGVYDFGGGVTAMGAYADGANLVVVKYSPYGAPLWARSVAAGPDISAAYAVAVVSDYAVVAGCCMGNGAYEFGDSAGVTPAGPDANALVVKYSKSGTAVWARSVVTGPNHSCFYAAAASSDGIYAAGYIDGSKTFNFGNGQEVAGVNPYGNNAVLVRYDWCGNPAWARSVRCGNDDSAIQALAFGGDCVYAAGSMLGVGPYDFGEGVTLYGASTRFNAFLVKFDTAGKARWGKTAVTAPDDSSFLSVATHAECVYAAGYIAGNEQFNFGNYKFASGPYEGGANAVLVEYCTCEGGTLGVRSVAKGPQESLFNAVAAGAGGVYAAGYITGAAAYDFGNSALVSGPFASGNNMVLVGY